MSGTVRVYFILSKSFESYEVIAIDLFHLLIPSSYRGKSKNEVLLRNFRRHKNNNKPELFIPLNVDNYFY